MRKQMRLALMAAVSVAAMAGANAQAAIVASESFGSGATYSLTDGTGWGSGGNLFDLVEAPNLTHAYVNSTGQAVTVTNSQNVFRPLAAPITGSFYASFLINAGAQHTFDNFGFFSGGQNGTENFNFGVAWNGGSANSTYGSWVEALHTGVFSSIPVDSATHLFVVNLEVLTPRPDISGNTMHVGVFIDPDLSAGTLPATPSYSFDVTANVVPYIDTIRVEIRGDGSMDEIRLGTQLADVVAVPEPVSLGLLMGGSLLVLRRRRSL